MIMTFAVFMKPVTEVKYEFRNRVKLKLVATFCNFRQLMAAMQDVNKAIV